MKDLADKIIELTPNDSPLYLVLNKIRKKQALDLIRKMDIKNFVANYDWSEETLTPFGEDLMIQESVVKLNRRADKLYSVKDILSRKEKIFDHIKVQ